MAEWTSREFAGWQAYHKIKNEEQLEKDLEMRAQQNLRNR